MKESKIKVIALDVYGTMLPTEGTQVKRKGLDLLLENFKNQGVILCTCSDAHTEDVLSDFEEAELNPAYFDKSFKMERKGKYFTQEPKNFTPILQHYKINSDELLVIGDRMKRDIEPAQELGCKAILVPEYDTEKNNDFDINSLEIK